MNNHMDMPLYEQSRNIQYLKTLREKAGVPLPAAPLGDPGDKVDNNDSVGAAKVGDKNSAPGLADAKVDAGADAEESDGPGAGAPGLVDDTDSGKERDGASAPGLAERDGHDGASALGLAGHDAAHGNEDSHNTCGAAPDAAMKTWEHTIVPKDDWVKHGLPPTNRLIRYQTPGGGWKEGYLVPSPSDDDIADQCEPCFPQGMELKPPIRKRCRATCPEERPECGEGCIEVLGHTGPHICECGQVGETWSAEPNTFIEKRNWKVEKHGPRPSDQDLIQGRIQGEWREGFLVSLPDVPSETKTDKETTPPRAMPLLEKIRRRRPKQTQVTLTSPAAPHHPTVTNAKNAQEALSRAKPLLE